MRLEGRGANFVALSGFSHPEGTISRDTVPALGAKVAGNLATLTVGLDGVPIPY